METKTHKTALVVIPPETAWGPIQAIRREHDRNIHRWMPHITLLYPFRPVDQFDALADTLAQACATVDPFEITLAEFRFFRHNPRSFTLWLAPDPRPLQRLQEAVWRAVPDCDDTRQFQGGFIPHLSIGQADSRTELQRMLTVLQAQWEPLKFQADRVSLIYRNDPPDDVFRVNRHLALGASLMS